jgi:hypothetical protein
MFPLMGGFMPRGSKKSYTSKQKRQAHHIEDSVKGSKTKDAERIAWATVNKKKKTKKKTTKKKSTKKKSSRK